MYIFEIDLQLFGGGGSSSGLGSGGGMHEYTVRLLRPSGKIDTRKFKGKTEQDALNKAKKYAKQEGYKAVDKKAKLVQ